MNDNEIKYIVNHWYDNVDENNRYEYKLLKTEEFTGKLNDKIKYVNEYFDGFYFKIKDNLPLTLTLKETNNVINVYYSAAYRQDIYDLSTSSITDSVSRGDASIFFKLLACIYGDLYIQAKNIDDVISIDKTNEKHLRHLAKLVNYPWSEALTADQQRESIKFYTMLRKMRGTNFAITNLIRIFGQSAETLYQPTDSTGVRIFEYYEGNNLGMFPGDIRVEIPEMSKILRDAIEDVKLMGTRLTFAYRLPIGTEYEDEYGVRRGYRYNVGFMGKITSWLQPGLTGWDKVINPDEVLTDSFGNQLIYKYRDTHELRMGADVNQDYSKAYTDLWMFQEYGLHDVRGKVLNNGVIDENLFLYR